MASYREQGSDRYRLLSTVTKTPHPLEQVQNCFNNLPTPITSLIGRESERLAICALLVRPEIRLVTMTGTGGIGKTRLALSCASDVLDTFTNGASFVSLASINNSDFVLPALIQTLGIKEQSDLPLIASLKHALHNKHLLLVLDNFEHVIDAAPLLFDLLQSCPELKLLVTSRARLHMPGEHIFPVPPLAVPNLKLTTASELATNPSLMLFVERACALKPNFQVTDSNVLLLAKICRQLDGLPLALELAAARVNLLSPQQLLTRLSRSLDLLSQPGNAVPKRQQTMRQTIQWSYDLLNAREQQLLCRLAVFVEGGQLGDIEAFYTLLGDDPAWVLDGVSSLFDKSLIFRSEQEELDTRLSLPETIREFGREMLAASNQLERIRATHATYYASLVPIPEPAELALAEGEWLAQLKREHKNMLAALHFFQENQKMVQALQLAIGIGGIWSVNGYGSEGQEELEQVVTLCQQSQASVPPALYVTALTLTGRIASYNTDMLQTKHWYRESLRFGRTLEDKRFLVLATAGLAFVEAELGNYAEFDALYEKWVPRFRQSGEKALLARILAVSPLIWLRRGMFERARADAKESIQLVKAMSGQQWTFATALHVSGWIDYIQGAWTSAHAYGKESLILFRQLGFPTFGLEALCTFAYETAALGDSKTARTLFKEALTLSQEAGDTREIGRALCGLGYLALRENDLVGARLLFEDSTRTVQQIRQLATSFTHILASSLEGLAVIASAEKQAMRASWLLGAADILRHQWSYIDPLGKETPFWESTRQAAQEVLGETTFTKAFNEGQRLTPLQALAAQEPGKNADGQIHSASTTTGTTTLESVLPVAQLEKRLSFNEHLTKREGEVLRLLAQGLSNAQIAENLVLSVVTVNSYLRSIYSKFGVSSRTGAVRYALDHHLI